MIRRRRLASAIVLAACWACGGTPTGTAVEVASVTVEPDGATLGLGQSVQLVATLRDAAGNVLIDRPVTFTSSNSSVAAVSSTGLASAEAAGTASITAAAEGENDAVTILVQAPSPGARTAADNFDRADGPLGANWSGQTANLTLEGGEVSMIQTTGNTGAVWAADAFGPDQFSEVVIGSLNGGSILDFRGIQVFTRFQSGTSLRYAFHYFADVGDYQIKFDGGTPGVVLASLPAPPPGPGDVLRVDVRGSTIRGFVNGQLVLQVTHTQLTGGEIGFLIGYTQGGQVLPRRTVTSWAGGEL
jgi:hypothetical protein